MKRTRVGRTIYFRGMSFDVESDHAEWIDALQHALEELRAFVETYERANPDPNTWPDLHIHYNAAKLLIAKAEGRAS